LGQTPEFTGFKNFYGIYLVDNAMVFGGYQQIGNHNHGIYPINIDFHIYGTKLLTRIPESFILPAIDC
jgi:hypothetical protein